MKRRDVLFQFQKSPTDSERFVLSFWPSHSPFCVGTGLEDILRSGCRLLPRNRPAGEKRYLNLRDRGVSRVKNLAYSFFVPCQHNRRRGHRYSGIRIPITSVRKSCERCCPCIAMFKNLFISYLSTLDLRKIACGM